uniref:F-box/LRR-repeat protein 15-like leucin rich repeat domain-containing protein n=1 Tax=Timema tahoe TaxID=61484 RepID=A0A7R9NX09_9NEOP|nr:unnamed protein product [Timema tahoe]
MATSLRVPDLISGWYLGYFSPKGNVPNGHKGLTCPPSTASVIRLFLLARKDTLVGCEATLRLSPSRPQSYKGWRHSRRCAVGLTLTLLSVTGRCAATVSMDCREERSQASQAVYKSAEKIGLSRKQFSLVRLCRVVGISKDHRNPKGFPRLLLKDPPQGSPMVLKAPLGSSRFSKAPLEGSPMVLEALLGSSRLPNGPQGSSRLIKVPRGSSMVLMAPLASPMVLVAPLGSRMVLKAPLGSSRFPEAPQALFELELAGCNEITEAGLWACLTPRVVSLTLTDCINVADEAVGAVAQLLPSLYEFSLQAYHVTDAALGYFSPKQSNSLSILRLQSCWELTNHGVVNIVHSLPNLTVLSLSGCSKITDEGVELIAENLQKLRSLDLSWCPRITDAALEYIACDLNLLEELTLDRCVHVTDIGVGYISTMLSLSALFLRWCSQVRDFGLQHLCGMRNLQVLSLAGCPLLTSSGLSSLIQLRHLQELELTNCPGASRELFEYLREHLPRCLVIE